MLPPSSYVEALTCTVTAFGIWPVRGWMWSNRVIIGPLRLVPLRGRDSRDLSPCGHTEGRPCGNTDRLCRLQAKGWGLIRRQLAGNSCLDFQLQDYEKRDICGFGGQPWCVLYGSLSSLTRQQLWEMHSQCLWNITSVFPALCFPPGTLMDTDQSLQLHTYVSYMFLRISHAFPSLCSILNTYKWITTGVTNS